MLLTAPPPPPSIISVLLPSPPPFPWPPVSLQNLVFGISIFVFNAFTNFSGQYMYSDVYMTLFNVIFTAVRCAQLYLALL